MRRSVVFAIVLATLMVVGPTAVIAGVEPSPFRALGQAKAKWTPPGQIAGFDPTPAAPGFTPKLQLSGFDPQPEPPGRVKGLWSAPGHIVGFDPQPEPPGHAPVSQVDVILN